MISEEYALEKLIKRVDLPTHTTTLLASQNSSQCRVFPTSNGFGPNFSRSRGHLGRGKHSGNQGRGFNFEHFSRNFPGRGNSGGRSFSFSQMDNRISCQICGHLGHYALDCFNIMNYNFQSMHPPTQLATMVAS